MRKILAVAAIFLSGCAFMPVHDVDVSQELIKNPVRSIYVFMPAFPDKLPKSKGAIDRPESYREMRPKNQDASIESIIFNLYWRVKERFPNMGFSTISDVDAKN